MSAPDPTDAGQADSARTLMWEAKAAAGRDAELLAFALEHADPAAQVYCSADARVVVIDPSGTGLPEPPSGTLARVPHVWSFRRIAR